MEFKDPDYVYKNVIQLTDQDASRKFIANVFLWMFVALGISAFCAFAFANTPSLLSLLISTESGQAALTPLAYVAMFSPLAFVLLMRFGLNRISYPVLALLFVAYAAVTGVSLSFILLIYTSASVFGVFAISALVFGVMAIAGYTTNIDLTNFGSIMIMLLVGVVIASLVNFFMHSSALYYIISYVGIAVFTGLTAYDVQKLKNIGAGLEYGDASAKKMALMGGLTLYLDFINLFLMILRLFGRRR